MAATFSDFLITRDLLGRSLRRLEGLSSPGIFQTNRLLGLGMLDPIRSCWTSCYTTENLQPTACGFMRVRGWALGHLDRKAAAAWLMSTSQKTHSANFCYNFKHNWWRNSYQGKVFLKDIGRRRKSINFMISIKKINSSQFQKKMSFMLHRTPWLP